EDADVETALAAEEARRGDAARLDDARVEPRLVERLETEVPERDLVAPVSEATDPTALLLTVLDPLRHHRHGSALRPAGRHARRASVGTLRRAHVALALLALDRLGDRRVALLEARGEEPAVDPALHADRAVRGERLGE